MRRGFGHSSPPTNRRAKMIPRRFVDMYRISRCALFPGHPLRAHQRINYCITIPTKASTNVFDPNLLLKGRSYKACAQTFEHLSIIVGGQSITCVQFGRRSLRENHALWSSHSRSGQLPSIVRSQHGSCNPLAILSSDESRDLNWKSVSSVIGLRENVVDSCTGHYITSHIMMMIYFNDTN